MATFTQDIFEIPEIGALLEAESVTEERLLELVEVHELEEALLDGPAVTDFSVVNRTIKSSIKTGLAMRLPVDLDGRAVDPNLTTYSVELETKILTRAGVNYTYFDQARAIRE